MKIGIIGGGASGLVASINLARKGYDVTILEANNKCGKKLAITGNGHCNYWNTDQDLNHYASTNKEIFSKIYDLNNHKVLDFFTSIGIVPKINNGYYYPFSKDANSFASSLIRMALSLNVKIIYETKVEDIKKGEYFLVKTNNGEYQFDKVILATGGKSYPKTGSDGSGYDLAKKLGHSIIPTYPALVQIVGQDNYYKDWAGVRSDAIVSLKNGDKVLKVDKGEVQFTDYGLSGICIFNLSSLVKNNKDLIIELNLVPWFQGNKKDLIAYLDKLQEEFPTYSIKEIMEGFLHYKLVNLILKLLKIDHCTFWVDTPQEKLASLLMSFPFKVKETKSFDDAQVTGGGIPLSEINPSTMESNICPGLYFAGEILDVNGDCGGYNLGFAWMSALNIEVANDKN